ncbi:peptidoglycan endopeptidase (plasmid) [Enterococcus gilvus]|jgi:cell wall-associated NlpC family hydrolase|uniref:NlpC/P60 family protein n=1 Tax=Enterococcus gilvus TaxID=160453 RepID=UPI000DF63B31|nr:NlpC/P60 family protein [Enterococcus gilvus]AXG40153.1 peptidoglycan endopeptidase [Enterococcus gilvus]
MRKSFKLRLFSASLSLLSVVAFGSTGIMTVKAADEAASTTSSSILNSESTTEATQDSGNKEPLSNSSEDKETVVEGQDSEEKKALEAGFTKEQYDQIMSIPDVEEAAQPRMSRSMGQQNSIVSSARAQIGKPYAWGAAGPNAFDCGGLVKYVYKQATNTDLPMGTTNQEKYGTEASLGSLQPGDLLFYGNRGATYHVGIYVGNNQMIHSPQPGQTVKAVDITYFYPNFARRIVSSNGTDPNVAPTTDGQAANERYIFRMYNKNDGQHHYTQIMSEANNLIKVGWNYEGVGWVSPTTGTSVYRMYNPNNGRHHYTPYVYERDNLVKAGWKSEGVSWYSGGSVPVYRLYNPHAAPREDSHHYTPLASERDSLVKVGWRSEGTAWYAARTLK